MLKKIKMKNTKTYLMVTENEVERTRMKVYEKIPRSNSNNVVVLNNHEFIKREFFPESLCFMFVEFLLMEISFY